MRIFSWRWTLALVQITLATAAFVYAPTQWKARPHMIGDCTLVGWRYTWPPPVLRTSYAVNFPALAASIPVRFARWSGAAVVRSEKPLFWLSVEDAVFLLCVGGLWYWLGAMLDRPRARRSSVRRRGPLAILGLTIGCLLAIGVVALATFYTTLAKADRPYRQIGPFGLIWGVGLFCHFGWRIGAILRPPKLGVSSGSTIHIKRWTLTHRPSAKPIAAAVGTVLLLVITLFSWMHFQIREIPLEQLNSWQQLAPPPPPPPPPSSP